MNEVILYEELSMNAHPALKKQMYDGWILCFGNGYTNRANSIQMIYPSELLAHDKIVQCEKLYQSQGLPTVFKITPLSISLDSELAKRGYQVVTPTNQMFKQLTGEELIDDRVTIQENFSKQWQNIFFKLNKITNLENIKMKKKIEENILTTVLCASIMEEGEEVACGSCVLERGYVGLYDIIVDEKYRKKGYGFMLCSALLGHAYKLGATNTYLNVVADNLPAVTLYKKLGFKDCYQYWYRVKK